MNMKEMPREQVTTKKIKLDLEIEHLYQNLKSRNSAMTREFFIKMRERAENVGDESPKAFDVAKLTPVELTLFMKAFDQMPDLTLEKFLEKRKEAMEKFSQN